MKGRQGRTDLDDPAQVVHIHPFCPQKVLQGVDLLLRRSGLEDAIPSWSPNDGLAGVRVVLLLPSTQTLIIPTIPHSLAIICALHASVGLRLCLSKLGVLPGVRVSLRPA